MARLRHFAVCVNDLDKAAKFYETVFDLKRIAREDLDIGSAIYMSDRSEERRVGKECSS